MRPPAVLPCVDVARCRTAGRDPLQLCAELLLAGASVWWRDTVEAGRDERLAAALRSPAADRIHVGGDPTAGLHAGARRLHLPARVLGSMPPSTRDALRGLDGVGASVHNPDELALALACGVAYVTASPVFPTASKPGHIALLGLDGLRALCRVSPVPVLALGGVTAAHVDGVCASGAQGIAAIGPSLGADAVPVWRALRAAVAGPAPLPSA